MTTVIALPPCGAENALHGVGGNARGGGDGPERHHVKISGVQERVTGSHDQNAQESAHAGWYARDRASRRRNTCTMCQPPNEKSPAATARPNERDHHRTLLRGFYRQASMRCSADCKQQRAHHARSRTPLPTSASPAPRCPASLPDIGSKKQTESPPWPARGCQLRLSRKSIPHVTCQHHCNSR